MKRRLWVAVGMSTLLAGAAMADVCTASKTLYDYAKALSEGGNVRLSCTREDADVCKRFLDAGEERYASELVQSQGYGIGEARREARMEQARSALYAAVSARKECETLTRQRSQALSPQTGNQSGTQSGVRDTTQKILTPQQRSQTPKR